MNNLWDKPNYKSNIQFLIDIPIREYDISKANINVLRDANILSEDQYQYFLHCPKLEREIAIGKMQGNDPSISLTLKEGITNARRVFMEMNAINPSDVLAIRNDAIMVIGDRYMKTDITDRVRFRLSGDYRSFYRINRMHLYYNFDLITKTEVLDIKGLGDLGVALHKNFMLEFISELFYTAQIEGVEMAIKLLANVYTQYINKSLSIEYYRELNEMSRYKLLNMSNFSSWYLESASEYHKKLLDISYNEQIFRELNRIYASIYFKTKH